MSVKRRDLVKFLENNGYRLLREGGNHSIYTNNRKVIPSDGIVNLTESQLTNFASKRVSIRFFDMGLYHK
ncbi:MAG: mRNA interferase HicA [Thermodesulfobacteriota bacterium]|nr:mRNA interferase HicA [Thermodesulfobacteriota bacterium]